MTTIAYKKIEPAPAFGRKAVEASSSEEFGVLFRKDVAGCDVSAHSTHFCPALCDAGVSSHYVGKDGKCVKCGWSRENPVSRFDVAGYYPSSLDSDGYHQANVPAGDLKQKDVC